jgi:hypothetical protein
VPLDAAVELAAVLMFREEGLEIVEQISIPLVAYSATLTGRRGHVNVSDCRHYFPFGPPGTNPSQPSQVKNQHLSALSIPDQIERGKRCGRIPVLPVC